MESREDIERYLILFESFNLLRRNRLPIKKDILEAIDNKKLLNITEENRETNSKGRGKNEEKWQHNFQCRIDDVRYKKNYLKKAKGNEGLWIITTDGYQKLFQWAGEIQSIEKEKLFEIGGTQELIESAKEVMILKKRYDEISKFRNRLVYGAPGTGKSYMLQEDAKILTNCDKEYQSRITFYRDYTYGKFIGEYKPVPIYSDELKGNKLFKSSDEEDSTLKKPYVSYEFVPGIFIEVLCKALKDSSHNYVLIIEEINRGNAAAIFGEAFQLLDRDSDDKSIYDVKMNDEVMNYVSSKMGGTAKTVDNLYIPSNMYIWATMNPSDQGVDILDSAFKRRWRLEYIGINENEDKNDAMISMPFFEKEKFFEDLPKERRISWNWLRREINGKIMQGENIFIKEDKLLGPFFITKSEIDDNTIKSKLIIYLKDDILKSRYAQLFDGNYKTTSDLLEAYNLGRNIFTISNQDFKAEIETVLKGAK